MVQCGYKIAEYGGFAIVSDDQARKRELTIKMATVACLL